MADDDGGDEKNVDNVKASQEGWTDDFTKNSNRRCTDFLFLILLICAWIAMTVVGFIACGAIKNEGLPAGEPARLTNSIDYKGRVCGLDNGVKSKKYGYYLLDKTSVCVRSCPKVNDYYNFICKDEYQSKADNSTLKGYEYVVERRCMYKIKTKLYLNRCIPNTNTLAASTAASLVSSSLNANLTSAAEYATQNGKGWFTSFMGDVITLRGYLFGFGFGVSVGVAFLYLYILRIPGFLMLVIWSIVIGIFVLMVIGASLLRSLSNTWSADGEHGDGEVVTMRVISYIMMVVCFLYFCLMVVMRKRIQLAIHVVEAAAKAIATMPGMILMPVVQTFGLACFLAVWVVYVMYLASSGKMVTNTGSYVSNGQTLTYTYRTFEYTTNTKYAFLYMLFCWYWTSEFVIALGQLTISMAVSCWYFTRDKSLIGNGTVIWAVRAVSYYHSGTAAFGSLIIAIIKTIRTVIAYIQNKAKKSHNKVLEYAMCILGCCMWCLEKCMKFLNKHAYILTAIYSYSFCKAARRAFFLLLRNILRVAAVNMISSFLLTLGKFFVPILTTFLCYLALAYSINSSETSGIVSVLIFTFLISYWISSLFSEIFAMAIETILFCFIADEEMFPVEQRYAEGALATTLQKTAQAAAQMKAAQKSKISEAQVAPTNEKNGEEIQNNNGTTLL
eukprot:gene9819-13212_t